MFSVAFLNIYNKASKKKNIFIYISVTSRDPAVQIPSATWTLLLPDHNYKDHKDSGSGFYFGLVQKLKGFSMPFFQLSTLWATNLKGGDIREQFLIPDQLNKDHLHGDATKVLCAPAL